MKWEDVAPVLGRVAPILGTLVGGPAGAAIGGVIGSILGTDGTPDAITKAIATNPDAALKLAQFESDNKLKLQGMLLTHADAVLAADTAAIQSVNATMQAEAKAEHWPTYSWRPFIGFIFGVVFLGVYLVLPLAHIPVPTIPTEAWLAIGSVLGVASYFRGKAQADSVALPKEPFSR
jgi:roadblock/LC7 domain-containing protein